MLVWVMRFVAVRDGSRAAGYLVIAANKAEANPEVWLNAGYRHAGTHKGVLEDAGSLPLNRRLFWATGDPGAGEPYQRVQTTHVVLGKT